jgi:beta-lactamase regulating signal transducer with metallopeptidase domain
MKKTRREINAEEHRLPVYVTNAVDTPCLFGLFRPTIYVTPEAAENATILRHTVEHETTHLRHGDNFWPILRGICLALHWYNPLVWWAAFLSRRDAELACDEATIRRIGEDERAEYGRTLIGMTCQKHTALLITATTMTGSKNSIKERITLIAKKPKTAIYTLVAVVFVAAVAAGCTFTGAKKEQESFSPTRSAWRRC